jgi:hypothetical protein
MLPGIASLAPARRHDRWGSGRGQPAGHKTSTPNCFVDPTTSRPSFPRRTYYYLSSSLSTAREPFSTPRLEFANNTHTHTLSRLLQARLRWKLPHFTETRDMKTSRQRRGRRAVGLGLGGRFDRHRTALEALPLALTRQAGREKPGGRGVSRRARRSERGEAMTRRARWCALAATRARRWRADGATEWNAAGGGGGLWPGLLAGAFLCLIRCREPPDIPVAPPMGKNLFFFFLI